LESAEAVNASVVAIAGVGSIRVLTLDVWALAQQAGRDFSPLSRLERLDTLDVRAHCDPVAITAVCGPRLRDLSVTQTDYGWHTRPFQFLTHCPRLAALRLFRLTGAAAAHVVALLPKLAPDLRDLELHFASDTQGVDLTDLVALTQLTCLALGGRGRGTIPVLRHVTDARLGAWQTNDASATDLGGWTSLTRLAPPAPFDVPELEALRALPLTELDLTAHGSTDTLIAALLEPHRHSFPRTLRRVIVSRWTTTASTALRIDDSRATCPRSDSSLPVFEWMFA
jgi:hypothetical protein